MRLCSGKEGGMAVSAVWRLVYFLAHAQRNQGTRENTGGASSAGDALCPSPKIQKQAAFGISACF